MRMLAKDVFQLRGFPPNAINVYLVGDVLVDAASRHAGGRILRQVQGRKVTAHALTHAHPDHSGLSALIREEAGAPVCMHTNEHEALQNVREPEPWMDWQDN